MWNMNYHAEHHLSPMVPFHALPALHEVVKDRLVREEGSLNVYKKILDDIAYGRETGQEVGALRRVA